MARPQLEDGFVRIANEILEALIKHRLSGQELRLVLFVIRKTYGYNKKDEFISLTEMAKELGTSKIRCAQIVKKLELRKILTVKKNINGIGKKYRFNKDYEQWITVKKNINRLEKTKRGVKKKLNGGLRKNLTVSRENANRVRGNSTPKDNIKDKIKNNNNAYALLSVFDKTDPCANEREIFEFWNKQGIIRHREFERFKPHIKKRLRKYTKEEIKQAIANYALVLKSKEYFWSYKWSLDQFLTRKNGLDRFLPGNFSKEDFLVRSPPKRLTREEQIDLAFERFEKMHNGGEKKDNDTSRF